MYNKKKLEESLIVSFKIAIKPNLELINQHLEDFKEQEIELRNKNDIEEINNLYNEYDINESYKDEINIDFLESTDDLIYAWEYILNYQDYNNFSYKDIVNKYFELSSLNLNENDPYYDDIIEQIETFLETVINSAN